MLRLTILISPLIYLYRSNNPHKISSSKQRQQPQKQADPTPSAVAMNDSDFLATAAHTIRDDCELAHHYPSMSLLHNSI